MKIKTLLILLSLIGFLFTALLAGAVGDRLLGYRVLDQWFPRQTTTSTPTGQVINQRIVTEESAVIEVVENVSPSVVTVGVKKIQRFQTIDPFAELFDPFGSFSPGQLPEIHEEQIEQDIGTGFIISAEGIIVTNKHVVNDLEAEYKIITKENKEYQVEKIYQDPVVDLSILKINASGLRAIEMGDSDNLKVGQFVIAIGTALGEFRHTVTTGVISGLGRGIEAGTPYGGFSERLDNVIQTDAAINPGNSGGPLLNSAGQVIGVNVATAGGADNVSFAIPINIVKEALDNFNQTGRFDRAFLGVRYKMISKDLAILNEVPEGAYVVETIESAPADKAGIKPGDIITKLGNKNVSSTEGGLAKLIQEKRIGETTEIEYWREGKTLTVQVMFEEKEE